MSSKADEQEMLERLRELEEENARLRSAAKSATPKPTVTESEYKGHPTLNFEGAFRPFSLGLKKLLVIREVWPEVEAFLERHGETLSKQPASKGNETLV
jgi:hypothetical protein